MLGLTHETALWPSPGLAVCFSLQVICATGEDGSGGTGDTVGTGAVAVDWVILCLPLGLKKGQGDYKHSLARP